MVEPSTADRIVQQLTENRVAIGAATVAGTVVGVLLLFTVAVLSNTPHQPTDYLIAAGACASLSSTLAFGWTTGIRIDTSFDSVSLLANVGVLATILLADYAVYQIVINGEEVIPLSPFVAGVFLISVCVYIPVSVARDVFERYSVGDDL